mmetsp:Transcript_13329/g.36413  ORF Transcript_13329/g.36413 Transcript_13329/m.36413 type:complete len:232 (-) Transcript_13329:11-706(-)
MTGLQLTAGLQPPTITPLCMQALRHCSRIYDSGLEIVEPTLKRRVVTKIVNQLLQRILVLALGKVIRLLHSRFASIILRLKWSNKLIKVVAPVVVLLDLFHDIPLLSQEQLALVIILLPPILQYGDFLLEIFDKQVFAHYSTRHAREHERRRHVLALLSDPFPVCRDHRVLLGLLDLWSLIRPDGGVPRTRVVRTRHVHRWRDPLAAHAAVRLSWRSCTGGAGGRERWLRP